MRYKNLVLERLDQIENTVNKVQFFIDRGVSVDQINEIIDQLKSQIEQTKEIVSVESDNFEQQFAPRQ